MHHGDRLTGVSISMRSNDVYNQANSSLRSQWFFRPDISLNHASVEKIPIYVSHVGGPEVKSELLAILVDWIRWRTALLAKL